MVLVALALLVVLRRRVVAEGQVAQQGGIGTPLLSTPLITTLNEQAAKISRARQVRCLSPARFRWHPGHLVPRHMRRYVIGQRRARLERVRRMEDQCTPWYVTKQIWAGNILGRESAGDPWPNCPDPYDGGGYSWTDTVNCENGGNWLDSPGFYRCGLQFHPNWETRFGRLCP